ncbi:MAG: acyl-CoA desaturase [Gammaproteobacteria bacterium]
MSAIVNFKTSRLWYWLINDNSLYSNLNDEEKDRIDGWRFGVFILIHLGCLTVFTVGVSWFAITFALFLYVSRMFFITAFYHRYFSHRTYRVSRTMQFLMAFAGCTAGQRGPLWWASHHREHHLSSDTEHDPHSPKNGMLNSHTLWFFKKKQFAPVYGRVKDMVKYPELTVLEKLDWLPFLILAVCCYLTGDALQNWIPGLETNGPQLLVWGFFISTVALYHATFTINSLCHSFGHRRFNTNDDSRNNFLLALLTLGEGWHNNHHRFPVSTRQGFYWWELDLSYIALYLMSKIGLISNINPVPISVFQEAEKGALP